MSASPRPGTAAPPWGRPLVAPVLVAEFSADVSQDDGVWRHQLRCERLRLDAAEAEVPPFGETQ
ncbi:hypothetical protein [Streptomyces pratensis]|uniref:hypothetical protein n=1 Tax=Streptomyces pratensis TaxID=1169025 RepID=UPI0019342370|nr:hypothetical protein [Streptomyces pratensis]